MASTFESRCCRTPPTYVVIVHQRSRCSHFYLNVTYRDDGIGAATHTPTPYDILISSSAPFSIPFVHVPYSLCVFTRTTTTRRPPIVHAPSTYCSSINLNAGIDTDTDTGTCDVSEI